MKCGDCGLENSDEAQFCEGCGKRLIVEPKTCAACGIADRDTAKFCVSCGKSLEPALLKGEPEAAATAVTGTAKTIKPVTVPPPRTGGHKIAAICIWIFSVILILLFFSNSLPTEEARACIAQGGSGQQCGHAGLAPVFGVLALLSAGLGWRYWRK